jgi:hypothetical protein
MSTDDAFELAFPDDLYREVDPSEVPALVLSGVEVWSAGYGEDDDGYTTIAESDLWAWRVSAAPGARASDRRMAAATIASWAPFRTRRLDILPVANVIVDTESPAVPEGEPLAATVAYLGALRAIPAGDPAPADNGPEARILDIIAQALVPPIIEPSPYQREQARSVLTALVKAGYEVLDNCVRCDIAPSGHWCADGEGTFE